MSVALLLRLCVSLVLAGASSLSTGYAVMAAPVQGGSALPTLKLGTEGEPVLHLQALLKEGGFYLGPVLGYFGPSTEAAVRVAQRYYHLPSTGRVDRTTWQALHQGAAAAVGTSVQTSEIAAGGIPLRNLNRLQLVDRGMPEQRSEAASRSLCPSVKQPLAALVPKTLPLNGSGRASVPGMTAREQPTFWFYTPYTAATGSARFVLSDGDDRELMRTAVPLPVIPGLLRLQLPASLPLAINHRYHWWLAFDCEQDSREADVMVDGWIKRIPLDLRLATKLEASPPRQRVILYSQAGLWYEALDTLVQAYTTDPQSGTLRADWSNLLNLVGLAPNSQQP